MSKMSKMAKMIVLFMCAAILCVGAGVQKQEQIFAKNLAKEVKKSKIIFDANGGNDPEIINKKVKYKKAMGDLPEVSRRGYQFKGWYSKAKGGKAYTEETIFEHTNDITLFAQWKANRYTIHFDGNGAVKGKMQDMECRYGKQYTLNRNRFVGETAFVGWNTEQDGSGEYYLDQQSVSNLMHKDGKVITLYAQWKKELVVTGYSKGIRTGTVRYVSQLFHKKQNGWGKYTGKGECGYASQSMALSYLGKDVSPGYLCKGEYREGRWRTGYTSTYNIKGVKCVEGSGKVSGKTALETLDKMLASLEADNKAGKVSPVVLHYSAGSKMHAILIVGKKSKSTYLAIDTAKDKQVCTVKITKSGLVKGNVTYPGYLHVDAVQQYCLSGEES